MAAARFHATYTLDGHKKLAKNRRWLDGFVSQQGQDGRLYDEAGSLVATARLAGVALEEGAEIEKGAFGQHIIVTVDVPCSSEEAFGGGAGGEAGAAPAAAPQAARACAAPTTVAAPSSRATAAGRHMAGGSGRRPTFKAPCATPAGQAQFASEPSGIPPLQQQAHPTAAPACVRSGEQPLGAACHVAVHSFGS